MDKQIQFSVNRNALILVSIIIGLLLLALCCGRGGRDGYKVKMIRGGMGEGNMMFHNKMRAVQIEDGRMMQPPTEGVMIQASSTLSQ